MASLGSFVVYCLVGVTGYLLFSSSPEETYRQLQAPNRSQDILEADFGADAGYSIKLA